LKRNGLSIGGIDLFEIHEAFGAQVAANMLLWERGWPKYSGADAIGKIPEEKINVNGGSIAVGHPFAATGGRLLLSAANELKRRNAKTAVISVCAAGAMAAAVLLRRP
jgi:acetyl-CoA acetyltransferase